MLCYRCGSHVPDGSEACGSCGQRFDATLRGGKTGTFQRRKLAELESAGVKIGELLAGRYEVKSLVGQGPLGVVVRALDREVDVEIGLKLVAPRLLQSVDERNEFLRLLRQAKRLSHPNLVRVYEMGVLEGEGDSGRPFFTMQLLDGLTLRRVIDLRREKSQPFNLREVEPIVAQIALALEHVKDGGPHGDIKPDNVIVLPDLLKVTDYGLGPAIPRLPFVAAQRARKADVYLSPELLAGRAIDARADVFSIGAILGELLAGVLPSSQGPTHELRSRNPELPPAIEAIYRRAVASNPDSRFPTAGDLAGELLAIAEKTAPPLPKTAPAAPAVSPPRRPAPPPPPLDLTPADGGPVQPRAEEPTIRAVKPPPPPPEPSVPPPAQQTKPGRAAPSRPSAAGSLAIEPGARPGRKAPPPPPPVEERGSRRGIWVGLALVALAATGFLGYSAFESWKAEELHRLRESVRADLANRGADAGGGAVAATGSAAQPAGTTLPPGPAPTTAAPVPAAPSAAAAPANPTAAPISPANPTAPVAPIETPIATAAPTPESSPADAGAGSTAAANPTAAATAVQSAPARRRSEHSVAAAESGGTSCPPGMRFIRPGSAVVGTPASDDLGNFGDRPARRVSVHGYCIDLYEYPNRADAKPLVGVSYGSAETACGRDGKRLCSEVEWEKGCKGPDDSRFPYGERFDGSACNDAKGGVRVAGSFSRCRSGYGLFDMSGNAAEWTSTRFESGVSDRTVKGGAYDGQDSDLRCSARQNRPPSSRAATVGFRCCAEPR